ncbi:MAG: glycosyltransferase, partial [Spirochaetes bacterium]|nr:glycosyltransferase [Spirochaetota bacterium]
YLLDEEARGRIEFLTFSRYNLRKFGAVKFLLGAAPGEIISFADSDVYFRPGWLEASIRVLEAFPEAGQVSALPTIDRMWEHCDNTRAAVQGREDLQVEKGDGLVPARYVHAHRVSIGKTVRQYDQSVGPREDIRIRRGDTSAYVSAQDFQFTTTRDVVDTLGTLQIESEDEFYDPIYSPVFEKRVDEKGFWRLSTERYLIHHIGNRLPKPDALAEEERWIFEDADLAEADAPASTADGGLHDDGLGQRIRHRIRTSRYGRRLLKRINAATYSLLYE